MTNHLTICTTCQQMLTITPRAECCRDRKKTVLVVARDGISKSTMGSNTLLEKRLIYRRPFFRRTGIKKTIGNLAEWVMND
jgi:hypothetical protein